MMLSKRLFFVLFVFFTSINGFAATAGSFHITPTQITLSSDGSIQTIKVKNVADRPTTFQLLITSEDDGESVTDKILAVPPIFDLPPSGEQTVRLAARTLELIAAEQAYTLWLKEVPAALPNDGAALAIALNLKLPLYVAPVNAAPKLHWQLAQKEGGDLKLVLTNIGNKKAKINSFWLEAWPEKRPLFVETSSKLIKVGDRQVWPLDFDLAALKEPPIIRAQTDTGPLEAVIPLPES